MRRITTGRKEVDHCLRCLPVADRSLRGGYLAPLRWMLSDGLATHERIPGYYFQLALQAEVQAWSLFHNFIPGTIFSEGWALHTEQLAGSWVC